MQRWQRAYALSLSTVSQFFHAHQDSHQNLHCRPRRGILRSTCSSFGPCTIAFIIFITCSKTCQSMYTILHCSFHIGLIAFIGVLFFHNACRAEYTALKHLQAANTPVPRRVVQQLHAGATNSIRINPSQASIKTKTLSTRHRKENPRTDHSHLVEMNNVRKKSQHASDSTETRVDQMSWRLTQSLVPEKVIYILANIEVIHLCNRAHAPEGRDMLQRGLCITATPTIYSCIISTLHP
jgi:hypothetical protein